MAALASSVSPVALLPSSPCCRCLLSRVGADVPSGGGRVHLPVGFGQDAMTVVCAFGVTAYRPNLVDSRL